MHEAAQAAAAPSTTDDMGPLHHSVALAVGALAVAHAAPAPCQRSPALRRAFGVRDRLADPHAVALTFDDGPHPHGTPATLEVLRAAGIRATFFLVGEQVQRDPAIAAEIAAAGHDVGVHGHRHRNLLRLAPARVGEDLLRGEEAIACACGITPRLYRPPYGILTTAALVHARRHGFAILLWTRWGRDWRARATPATIADDAAAGLRGSEVILLHDADHYSASGSWQRTVAALPAIIERIHDAGLAFCTG
jgi:peptidoglycan/xylan/chitin deacetylase (PgdA/CDA1 family)